MVDEKVKLKLEEALKEEMADHKKYLDMAGEVADHRIKGILCDIAHEEHTHMQALEHIMEMEAIG